MSRLEFCFWTGIIDRSCCVAKSVFQGGRPNCREWSHLNGRDVAKFPPVCERLQRCDAHFMCVCAFPPDITDKPCDEWLENRSSLVWHDWRIAYVLQQQLRSCDAMVLFKEMVFLSARGLRCKELHVWDQLLSRPEQACRIAFTLQDICYQRQSGWHH